MTTQPKNVDSGFEIDRLRSVLRERLKKVPDWINGASIQVVRDYKSNYIKAEKILNKKTATASDLSAAINSIS